MDQRRKNYMMKHHLVIKYIQTTYLLPRSISAPPPAPPPSPPPRCCDNDDRFSPSGALHPWKTRVKHQLILEERGEEKGERRKEKGERRKEKGERREESFLVFKIPLLNQFQEESRSLSHHVLRAKNPHKNLPTKHRKHVSLIRKSHSAPRPPQSINPEGPHIVHHLTISVFHPQSGLQQSLQNQHRLYTSSTLSPVPKCQMANLAEPDKKFTKVCTILFLAQYWGPKMNKPKEQSSRDPETTSLKAQTALTAEENE